MTVALPNPRPLQLKSGLSFAALCQANSARRVNRRGPTPSRTTAQREGGAASDAAIIEDILQRIGKTGKESVPSVTPLRADQHDS